MHVVLAALDHLHRPAGRLRQQHGVDHVVDERIAAKPAAHLHEMQRDLLGRRADRIGGVVHRPRRPLRAGPDFDRAVGLHRGHAGVRLHLRVIDVVGRELRREHAGGAGERGVGVAGGAGDHALLRRIAHMSEILLEVLFRIDLRAQDLAPLRLHLAASGEHRLDGMADHADAVIERNRVDDPGLRLDLVAVERNRARAAHRRTRKRGVDHARHLHVDGVERLAGHLVGHVDARHGLADQAELGLRLELLGLDRGQRSRAVGRSAATSP